jgi:hypothetical protein
MKIISQDDYKRWVATPQEVAAYFEEEGVADVNNNLKYNCIHA